MNSALRHCFFLLVLAGCATTRIAGPAPDVEVTLEPQAAEAFNLVWLNATITNRGPGIVWVDKTDSVEAKCGSFANAELIGLSPKGAAIGICRPCPYLREEVAEFQTLAPGQQVRVSFQVDFNRVFPSSFIDSIQNCGTYFNRTTGPYSFRLITRLTTKPGKGPEVIDTSRVVTVYRKQ